jgi:hypothetical protein
MEKIMAISLVPAASAASNPMLIPAASRYLSRTTKITSAANPAN